VKPLSNTQYPSPALQAHWNETIMPERQQLVRTVAEAILDLPASYVVPVAIDGSTVVINNQALDRLL
jgi:hypothetical protein